GALRETPRSVVPHPAWCRTGAEPGTADRSGMSVGRARGLSVRPVRLRTVLEEMRIRGLGVIDDATLELGRGLTVVTGETGAGKTMVITGLHLLFGGRADAARVRPGVGQALVGGRLRAAAAAGGVGGADPGGRGGRRAGRRRRVHRLPYGVRAGPVAGLPGRSRGPDRAARRALRRGARGARPVRPAAADARRRAAGGAG